MKQGTMSTNKVMQAIIAEFKRFMAYFHFKLFKDCAGGFLIDTFKGSPAAINGNPLTPITSEQASQMAQQLMTGQGLAGQQAQQTAGGVGQGINAQQGLLEQLIMQSQGGGPNPAQAALNNATGANVAQTAALMAGGRGTSANAGSTARQIGMAGAGIQQDAAGQAALMQAQQQLAAQQQAGQMAGQMVGQGLQGTQNLAAITGQGMGLVQGQNQNQIQNAAQMSGAQQQGYGNSIQGFGQMVPDQVSMMSHGGEVKGDAEVPGDSEANDTVPTLLSPGEIVIPRSYASDPKAAAAFAHAVALMSGRGKK